MIEHKAYECEFCGAEFEHDEYDFALKHEETCHCNPKNGKCGSCKYGKKTISYEIEYYQCQKLRPTNHSCGDWIKK